MTCQTADGQADGDAACRVATAQPDGRDNAVIGLTHLMRRDMHDPAQGERFTKVGGTAQHLLSVINDVLDLSKIESGKRELEAIDFPVDAMLSRSCALLAGAARSKGLELVIHTEGLPATLRGDPAGLSQALVNLLSNAVEFTDQGAVTLHARTLSQDDHHILVLARAAHAQRDPIVIAVVDMFMPGLSGPQTVQQLLAEALPEETPACVFVSAATDADLRRVARTLGVEQMLEKPVSMSALHDALMSALSDHHHESRPAPLDSGAESAVRRQHHGVRVLLAEDNPVNQEVAMGLLRMVGLEVDVAEDGERAVAMARAHPYPLILMDMQMPVKDGLQASREIRALPGRAQVPIIAMTANAFGEDRDACLAAGMNDHLAKPVDPALLYDTLQRWLGTLPPPGPG